MHWVCHPYLSFLILTQPDQTYFFVNWKMPQKMRWPTKAKWSKDEADKAAASVADIPISHSVVRNSAPSGRVDSDSARYSGSCGSTRSAPI